MGEARSFGDVLLELQHMTAFGILGHVTMSDLSPLSGVKGKSDFNTVEVRF